MRTDYYPRPTGEGKSIASYRTEVGLLLQDDESGVCFELIVITIIIKSFSRKYPAATNHFNLFLLKIH